MEDFVGWLSQSGNYLIAVFTVIAIIGGGITWIYRGVKTLLKPLETLQTTINSLEKKNLHYDQCLGKDQNKINQLESDCNILFRHVLLCIEHGIDGNHIEQLKSAKDEMHDYIIKRALGKDDDE